jgi:hypothetical protein
MRRFLQTRSGSRHRHACTPIVEPWLAIGQLMDVDAFDLSSSDSLDNVTPAANFDIYDDDDDAVAEPRHDDDDDDDDDNNDAAVAEPRHEFHIYDDDMDAPPPLPQDLDQFDLDMGADAGEEPAPHEAQLEALGGASVGEAGLCEAWHKMPSSAHGELLRSALNSMSSNYVLQRGGV